ncbi:MAG: carotenoid oxygenase family protein [Pseudomonadota bacterium]
MLDAKTRLTRRAFCQSALAGSLALASPRAISARPSCAQSRPEHAFASSFRDVPNSFGPTEVRFDKPLPEALTGTLYRNGPARMQRGDTRYNHWFDGDGMVHAFALTSRSVIHRAKMVATARTVAEAEAGEFLWSGFGTGIEGSRDVLSPDDLNVANISVLPLGDELLALWEAGSPYRMHAETLETLGRNVFSRDTDGLPFSAHPRIDPAGRIWNFGYMSGSGKLVLYDLETDGRLRRAQLVDARNADMVHDFAITERYLVFVLLPLHFHSDGNPDNAFIDSLHWDAKGTVDALVIDKQNLDVVRRFELPAFFAFHLGNAWEDGDTLRVEIATAPDFHPLMAEITAATRGERIPTSASQSQLAEITLNMRSGVADIAALPTRGIDFPRFDQRYTGQRTERLYTLGRSDAAHEAAYGFNAVHAFNRASGDETVFDYGADSLAEEHLFVPAPAGRANTGWLIGTRYNWRECRTTLSVFDAEHVADGPIAQAHLPYGLPMGLHGQFVAR